MKDFGGLMKRWNFVKQILKAASVKDIDYRCWQLSRHKGEASRFEEIKGVPKELSNL